jgi:hypothetical protein
MKALKLSVFSYLWLCRVKKQTCESGGQKVCVFRLFWCFWANTIFAPPPPPGKILISPGKKFFYAHDNEWSSCTVFAWLEEKQIFSFPFQFMNDELAQWFIAMNKVFFAQSQRFFLHQFKRTCLSSQVDLF